ncbi:MAG: BrnT family toxin [Verrucomicrobia bacterium]|nr:BrnT family toxin [Verrucomicrobiota bacterium]MCH8528543.1 BrnT family toxin [Kiritimatiellia bacterium]
MSLPKPSFEWDAGKNASNQEKHGVSFALAQFAFTDPDRVILKDLEHSDDEQRFFCLGRVAEGILTVRFTLRSGIIRIFGAGYWRKGRKIYEEQNQIH